MTTMIEQARKPRIVNNKFCSLMVLISLTAFVVNEFLKANHKALEGEVEVKATISINLAKKQNNTETSVLPYCCQLHKFMNFGHMLTENAFDLYRCGPIVSFRNQASDGIQIQLLQLAKILDTKVTENIDECNDFYQVNPSLHPEGSRMATYSLMDEAHNYDAIKIAKGLRFVQEKVLSSCGMDTPKYKEFHLIENNSGSGSGGDDDEGVDALYKQPVERPPSDDEGVDALYEQLVERPPSTSVIILQRDTRVLLSTDEILETCQGLNLSCRILETSSFFQQAKAEDLCFVLQQFENSVTIGVQGAEIIYPEYMFSRIILVTSWEIDPKKIQKRHYVKKNVNHFFFEFGLHLGSQLIITSGIEDLASMEKVKKSIKQQCIKTPHYCTDKYASIPQIESNLKRLINEGKLLRMSNNITGNAIDDNENDN